MRVRLACIASLCAVAPLASHAQAAPAARAAYAASAVSASTAAPAPALTLAEAYRLALEKDATLRTARAATDARRERLPQARAQLMPNLSASYGQNRNHLQSIQPGLSGPVAGEQFYNSDTGALTLRQPLYRPYQFADLAQAHDQVADANAQLEKEVQNLAVRVASAYMDCLLAEDQLQLVLQQKETYTANLDAAQKLFKAGSGVRTDIDEARAKLDMTIAQELEARQNVTYTRRALQVMVDVPVVRLAPLDPARMHLDPPSPPQLDDWLQRAEQSSPEILSLTAQRDAARRDIDKARAGHLPTLDAIAQWSITKSDSPTQINSKYDQKSVGIQFSLPLFAGGQVNSQIRQAVAALEQANESLEATRRDLSLRIEKEYRGVTEGVAKVTALEQAAKSADVMVVSSRKSFEGGARTLLDVLNAEEQRVTTLRDLAQQRYLYLLSRIRLQALVGGADDAVISEVDSALAP
ncbi:MAG TPA: TolC family outer membrane protein [Ramlibacter sp.]|jgi:TolC family type I secretion outer membrane protein|nr:TolC family outer membrane protein [Ramlibacter sp.]